MVSSSNKGELPWVDQVGNQTGIAEYDSNPFISCLPPPPSDEDCFHFLKSLPSFNEAELNLKPHLREQLAFVRIKEAFLPTGVQLRQAKDIDLLIRSGYVARNPSRGMYQAQLTDLAVCNGDCVPGVDPRRRGASDMAAGGMVVLGPSGIGKTTVSEANAGSLSSGGFAQRLNDGNRHADRMAARRDGRGRVVQADGPFDVRGDR
jgi:hypothetical protein